jgi:hypothetical protein
VSHEASVVCCLFWPCPGARPLDLAGGDRWRQLGFVADLAVGPTCLFRPMSRGQAPGPGRRGQVKGAASRRTVPTSELGLLGEAEEGRAFLRRPLLSDRLEPATDLFRVASEIIEPRELREALEAENALEERRHPVANGPD